MQLKVKWKKIIHLQGTNVCEISITILFLSRRQATGLSIPRSRIRALPKGTQPSMIPDHLSMTLLTLFTPKTLFIWKDFDSRCSDQSCCSYIFFRLAMPLLPYLLCSVSLLTLSSIWHFCLHVFTSCLYRLFSMGWQVLVSTNIWCGKF